MPSTSTCGSSASPERHDPPASNAASCTPQHFRALFGPTASPPMDSRPRMQQLVSPYAATTMLESASSSSAASLTSASGAERSTPGLYARGPESNCVSTRVDSVPSYGSRTGTSITHTPCTPCVSTTTDSIRCTCIGTSNTHSHTPLSVSRFSSLLASHPNPTFVKYVVHGLRCGFDVDFTGNCSTNCDSQNLPSAHTNPDFISAQLHASCSRHETAGPFPSPPFPFMRCSGIGAVPKKNGKLRMIHHLSSPEGQSVNDCIPADPFSLHYVTIDDAVNLIMQLPAPVYLAKLDVKSAFRQIPVRPEDWPLLGIRWQGQYFYERVLPFGLRSSPAIFDSVASAIEWIMQEQFAIPHLLHDDFLNACSGSVVAHQQLAILLRAFTYLGVPLAPAKVEGPAQVLTFLGIILDTRRLEARLPMDKLSELRDLLRATLHSVSISQRQLESLLGKLSFAARVVVPGRTFMRRLWSIASRYQQPYYRIKFSEECLEDLRWWLKLLDQWNGRSFFLHPNWTPSPDLQLYTDASGAIGWGAYNSGRWIQGRWTDSQAAHSIDWKELFAVVAACSTWGSEWPQLRILIHCDNMVVVECIRSGTSRSPALMVLLRELFFECAGHNFTVSAKHIPGANNTIADRLSRFCMQDFRKAAPSARMVADMARLPHQLM